MDRAHSYGRQNRPQRRGSGDVGRPYPPRRQKTSLARRGHSALRRTQGRVRVSPIQAPLGKACLSFQQIVLGGWMPMPRRPQNSAQESQIGVGPPRQRPSLRSRDNRCARHSLLERLIYSNHSRFLHKNRELSTIKTKDQGQCPDSSC